MNDGFNKIRELLLTDDEFRKKLQSATEAYKGEQTEEAVFTMYLFPLLVNMA